jgi:hypothetical protein
MRFVAGCVALLLLAASAAAEIKEVPQSRSLTIVLAAGEKRCFFANSKTQDDRFVIGFQVRKGSTDFDMEVKDPKQETVFYSAAAEHDAESRIFFVAQHVGEYSYCLDNNGGTRSEKVVAIQLATSSGSKKMKRTDPLIRSLKHISSTATGLLDDQIYLRTREREHRDTMESNNSRVLFRGLLELGVMLAMSVGQVYYLRRLFSKKSARPAA